MTLRHHSLVAWQRADELFIRVHKLTLATFPKFERFELGSQLRRAAFSVPVNIVEGFARRSHAERLHFLNIAESSLAPYLPDLPYLPYPPHPPYLPFTCPPASTCTRSRQAASASRRGRA